MRRLKSVYVYHYDEKECTWTHFVLENVLVSGTINSYSLTDTQNKDARLTVRVFCDEEVEVFPEDVISFEESPSGKPDMTKSCVVVSVADNRFGTKKVRHTKILLR